MFGHAERGFFYALIAHLCADGITACPTAGAGDWYSGKNRYGFNKVERTTNRTLGVDFQDRVTAEIIGISHSAEYLLQGFCS